MKQLYTFCTGCLLLAFTLWNQTTLAQQTQPSHTGRVITINSNCDGYYEYLPQGYNAGGTERYPVIIYFHGYGDIGNGSSDLNKLLANALPKYINDGVFPTSFTSNGQTFRFIIISPQFKTWVNPGDAAAVVNYVRTTYASKIDTNRIYLTGFSMGGGLTWDYAGNSQSISQRIAAIVPICGLTDPTSTRANNMAVANLPVWATHNSGDLDVPVGKTNTYIDLINVQSGTPPNPLAQKTIFQANGHDAWTKSYDPAWRDVNNMNVYEWMLQFTRAALTLPVKLEDYKIISADLTGVALGWKTTFEQNNASFTIERSVDGTTFSSIGTVKATNASAGSAYTFTDTKPFAGTNYYRLNQVDVNGKVTTYATLKAVVNEVRSGSVSLWPNPASSSITLSLNSPDKDRLLVKIVNTQGAVVQTNQYNKETSYWQQTIDLTSLPVGLYFVQVKGTKVDNTLPLTINK